MASFVLTIGCYKERILCLKMAESVEAFLFGGVVGEMMADTDKACRWEERSGLVGGKRDVKVEEAGFVADIRYREGGGG